MDYQGLLQQLMDIVEQTAPELWRIALQQVWVEAIQFMLLSFVIFLVFTLFAVLAIRKWRDRENWETTYDNDDSATFRRWVFLSVLSFGMLLLGINFVIGRLINPEYYAIQLLIDQIK